MPYTKMVNVDVGKIQKVLSRRGLKMKDMSIAMCHDYTYISGVIRRGTMSKPDALLFKQLYNVDVVVQDRDIISNNDEGTKPSIDYNKLGIIAQSIIDYDKLAEAYAKLAEAMEKVIDYDKLSEIICKAMVQALEGDSKTKTFEKRKLE